MGKKRSSEAQRAQIFALKATGLSDEKIGKKVGLTRQGVRYILQTYRPTDLAVRPRSGRPPKVSKRCLTVVSVSVCLVASLAGTSAGFWP